MSPAIKTKGKGALKVALLCTIAIAQADTIASVMLSDISAAFPDASNMAIQYIMQSAMIGAFVVSLAISALTTRFRKKPLILTGLVVMFLGGLVPVINHSQIWLLDLCGFLVGAGQGFLVPLVGSLILENFVGRERERMIGLNTTFLTGGSALMLMLAGPICMTGWVNVYYIYFIALPVFFVALLFLPDDEKKVESKEEPESQPVEKAPIPWQGWVQCVLVVMMSLAYSVFPLNLSFFVTEAGLGDATAVSAGMTTITVVSALMGLILPQFIKLSRLYLAAVGAAFGIAAVLCVIFAQNIPMVYVGTFLAGVFFGINMAHPAYYVSRICTPQQYGPTYSMCTSMNFLGIIVGPIVVSFLTNLWGGSSEVALNCFQTGLGLFIVALVLQIIWGTYLTRTLPSEESKILFESKGSMTRDA